MFEDLQFEKIVLVKRKTRLDELIERFNTKAQARFYIEHAGGDFQSYEEEDDAYRCAFETVRRAVEIGLKIQVLDRSLLPTCIFTAGDLIVTLGQDGLVANTAKYVSGQPIIGVNPDPQRIDGVLLPFSPGDLAGILENTMNAKANVKVRSVSLAEARLKDGQRLLAFNDLFIGAGSHVSARYQIAHQSSTENQSSSGIVVSTGAGSTGWLSSIFNETAAVASYLGGMPLKPVAMRWEEERLFFVVREPFISLHSSAQVVIGNILPHQPLILESLMPAGGVIFSDGVEADHLDFNSGTIASICLAREKANLVVA